MRLPVSKCAMIMSAFFFALPHSAQAYTWSPPARVGAPLGGYISALQKQTPGALFFADCAIGDGRKALMIFRAGSTEGRFYLLVNNSKDAFVGTAAHGEVSLRDGSVKVLKVTGAMPEMMPKVGVALMAGTFLYLPTGLADDMVRHRPLGTCSGQPNTRP